MLLIIGKQRSGKTALCYFLAQQTGRKTYTITAAREVPTGVYVIHDPDCVPEGGICIIDDTSLFFNSMRTKKTDEEYQLLRDILVISEKQDICFIFNTHDSSLLHSTILGQCRTLFFKESNLMFSGTERASIKSIMQYVQQGFIKIPKKDPIPIFSFIARIVEHGASFHCRLDGIRKFPRALSTMQISEK
ncbi:hypothetical protein METP3_01416 [Methanosarcinales archaeon]|nr:hypothetical protein METP3_01416 [Methanosarcinales archaeon]